MNRKDKKTTDKETSKRQMFEDMLTGFKWAVAIFFFIGVPFYALFFLFIYPLLA